MKRPCMTDAEYAEWMEAAREVAGGSMDPCSDCTLAFHAIAKLRGSCDSKPRLGTGGRTATARGRWAEASRRYRARKRAAVAA